MKKALSKLDFPTLETAGYRWFIDRPGRAAKSAAELLR
jgi:hypothetical protein